MSAEQQGAVVQEALDLSWFHRRWAALKLGLPETEPRNVVAKAVIAAAIPKRTPLTEGDEGWIPPQQPNLKTDQAATPIPPANGLIKKAIAASILTLAGGGIGATTSLLVNRGGETKPPEVAVHTPTPTLVQPAPPRPRGDLLEYLKQNGFNLPPQVPK